LDSTSFYAHILGLNSPWLVSKVDLNTGLGEVRVYVRHAAEDALICPECGLGGPIHDHAPERTWRHLDTCQFQTLLVCSVPRVTCPKHGVRQVSVAWAEAKSRFTLLFETLAIDLLLHCPRRRTAEIMGVSEDSLASITRRAVDRGLARKAKDRAEGTTPTSSHLTLDEKYWRGRRCATVVGDARRGVVEEMVEGNSTASAQSALKALGKEVLAKVESISMDLHGPFATAARREIGETKIVYDTFHVVKLVNDAMETVRRGEVNYYLSMKDKEGAKILKSARYSILRSPANQRGRSKEVVANVCDWFYQTGEAYKLKELLRIYHELPDAASVRTHLLSWIEEAKKSTLAPMVKLSKTIAKHLDGIVRSIELKVTNAAAESLNARIQAVRVKARGHRHYEAFRTSVLFHLGGLDLYPRTSGESCPVSA
jgi:transposase